jgi:murein DD-endopeptidase MepM/ murein hydrolase activator NlpD
MKLASALGASVLLCSFAAHSKVTVHNRRIEPNQTVAKALRVGGLDGQTADAVMSALEGVFEFRKSRAGDQLRLVIRDGELDYLDYRRGPQDEWLVRRDGNRLVGLKREIEVEKRLAVVELQVESSMWDAALAAGEDPAIAVALADVFAWDIDFYRDVQRGDRVRMLVEKYVSKGRVLRYGDVLGAAYAGSTVGKKRVFRYEFPSGERSYFLEDGASARKTFLKSPLKYSHLTSGFGTRFHPILNYVGAHNGVDYGTPMGTPVWSVADGTVTRAGWDNGGGNMVCVRHMNSMESCYLHLSKFGEGVRVGARVAQKQIIAFSGSTGLSTGPHLHFALKRGGAFVNPLNQNFPRADPVPAALRADFAQKIAPFASRLDALPVAAAGMGLTPEQLQ